MADDDDWETDPDYKNDLTEAQQRAFGNKETMDKYNAVMDKSGGDVGASRLPDVDLLQKKGPARLGEVEDGGIDNGLRTLDPTSYAQPSAPAPPPPLPKLNLSKEALVAPPTASPMAAGAQTERPAPVAQKPSAIQSARRRSFEPPATARVHDRAVAMSTEERAELETLFKSFDADSSGSITVDELAQVLAQLGTPTSKEKLTAMMSAADEDGSNTIDFDEFIKVVDRAKSSASLSMFADVITQQKERTVMQQKKDNIVHSFDQEECAAFRDFINTKLSHESSLSYLLPIRELGELFHCMSDGVLLCALVNVAVAETIDDRVVNVNPRNPFHVTENHNLALNACKSIGVKVVNIGSQDLIEGRPHLILGLIWQIVKCALLSTVNLKDCPFLVRMLQSGEDLEDLLKLPPEKLLMRWVNYHLERAGQPTRITNFGPDLKDGSVYCHLLQQIDPDKIANTNVLRESDTSKRAAYVIAQGKRLGAEFTIAPGDIVKGNEKLNLGFVAALFNACPGLDPPEEKELALMQELPDDDGGDSREERAFRMWVNSIGIDSYVNNLFDDVRDGIVILQTMDLVRKGSVDWAKVNQNCGAQLFKRTENLNYAVELGKSPYFNFSLVGVQGKDIVDGNRKLTLALIWQLFRCHLITFLSSLRKVQTQRGGKGDFTDEQIVEWANEKVVSSGSAHKIRDLHDKSLASGLFLIDLLAAVEPRCVDRSYVTPGATEEERKLNAKYAISAARKLGCSLFLLWEDIVEVRPKMMLSFVASVMALSLQVANAAQPVD